MKRVTIALLGALGLLLGGCEFTADALLGGHSNSNNNPLWDGTQYGIMTQIYSVEEPGCAALPSDLGDIIEQAGAIGAGTVRFELRPMPGGTAAPTLKHLFYSPVYTPPRDTELKCVHANVSGDPPPNVYYDCTLSGAGVITNTEYRISKLELQGEVCSSGMSPTFGADAIYQASVPTPTPDTLVVEIRLGGGGLVAPTLTPVGR